MVGEGGGEDIPSSAVWVVGCTDAVWKTQLIQEHGYEWDGGTSMSFLATSPNKPAPSRRSGSGLD